MNMKIYPNKKTDKKMLLFRNKSDNLAEITVPRNSGYKKFYNNITVMNMIGC